MYNPAMASPAVQERIRAVPELPLTERDKVLFIPPSEETAYCSEHNFEFERLPNGAKLLTGKLVVQDRTSAAVTVDFPSGSVNDPPGKSGLLHMYEHLASFAPNNFARSTENFANAGTSPSYIHFVYEGLANPDVREEGLWNVFPLLFTVLHHPETISDRLDERLATERGNVTSEINRYFLSQNALAERFVQQMTLGSDNPVLSRAFGTLEDIERITPEDILMIANQCIIPYGMTVSALSNEYDVPVHRELFRELRRHITAFPRTERRPIPKDRASFDRVNPQFTPGEMYINDTGLGNREATVSYIWVVQNDPYSIRDSVLSSVLDLAQENLHTVVRSNGLSYVTSAGCITPGEHTTLCYINVSLFSHPGPESFAVDQKDRILEGVFSPITEDYIQRKLESDERRRRAVSKSMRGRFTMAELGLQRFDRILDFDVMHSRLAAATPEDYAVWLRYFRMVPPAVFVTGDLSAASAV